MTGNELIKLANDFDEHHVWAYVLIDQSNQPGTPPASCAALRVGCFAITEIDYHPAGNLAKVSHLPSGLSLGGWMSLFRAKAYCMDLANVGAEADTVDMQEMRRLIPPVAIRHEIISTDRINPECQKMDLQRLNA